MSSETLKTAMDTEDIKSRLSLWRVVQQILLETKHQDLSFYEKLPDLVWSSFTNFHDYYRGQLSKRRYQEVLPGYILARPLIGAASSEYGHDTRSPLFTSVRDVESLQAVNHQLHLFRMYVGLSNCLKSVTEGREGAIARRTLQSPDPANFCYVFKREQESKIKIDFRDGIKEIPLRRQNRFAEEIDKAAIPWPQSNISDLRELSDTKVDHEKGYSHICSHIGKSVFDLLDGDNQSESLVAWWIHQAEADLILFRGFDEEKIIDPRYPWGGVWFLIDSPLRGDHFRALSLLVHECFNIATVEMRARESSSEKERANIGAGMFHNLAHYIFPLIQHADAIREFANDGDLTAVQATAVRIADSVGRLDRFQSAVQRHVKHRQAYDEEFIRTSVQSLEDAPEKAILIQTQYLEPQIRWFREKQNAPQDRKSLLLIRDLCPGAEELNPLDGDDREALYHLVRNLEFYDLPDNPNFMTLQDWWNRIFGLDIRVKGDFKATFGELPLVVGVLEELFFNALGAVAKVLAKARKDNYLLPRPHIVFEASSDKDGTKSLYIKNWSSNLLSQDDLKREPIGDRGWGLYGNRLLLKRAGGDLDVWEGWSEVSDYYWPLQAQSNGLEFSFRDGRVVRTPLLKKPLWVGFKLIPIGRHIYEPETQGSDN